MIIMTHLSENNLTFLNLDFLLFNKVIHACLKNKETREKNRNLL